MMVRGSAIVCTGAALAVALMTVSANAPAGVDLLDALEEGLVVRAFRTGPLGVNTTRVYPVGRAGATDVRRTDVLLLVFSAAVDPDSINGDTVRIGVPGVAGELQSVPGALYPEVERRFDPQAAAYYPYRAPPNRWFFDPTGRYEFPVASNPSGFEPDTEYEVHVPGVDSGAKRTVRTRSGFPLARSFRARFRTGPDTAPDWDYPSVVSIEADDAPGIPLDGRTDVDPRAAFVVTFSEPLVPSSFSRRHSFEIRVSGTWRRRRAVAEAGPDFRDFTIRSKGGRLPGGRPLRLRIVSRLVDRSGLESGQGTIAEFEVRPGP